MFIGRAMKNVTTQNRNISPSVFANYTLWLPKEQMLDFTGSFSYGHNKYSSLYDETTQSSIATNSHENNHAMTGKVQYFKTLRNSCRLART